MSEHSADDKAHGEKCEAIAQAVLQALEPFRNEGASTAIIGVSVALGSVISVTVDPNISYMRAIKTIRGIMDGHLLD